MEPINFKGATEFKKPASMTSEQCNSLFALRGIDENQFGYFLECWKPSAKDIEAINSGGNFWLKILSNTLPPVAVFTENPDGSTNPTFDRVRDAVQTLVGALRDDKAYFFGWQANIAMAFKDEWAKNHDHDVHEIANQAAENFLRMLIHQPDKE